MSQGVVVALLGAESTGKTTLAHTLAQALCTHGRDAVVVEEYLREFCALHARTPRRDEQRAIAAEQTRRIAAAADQHELVVADTTALMIAVYSEQVFDDTSLYGEAEAAHASCALTLLTALDLPWQADGVQRDGPHVREPVDTKVRAALRRMNASYGIVSGTGSARVGAALAAVRRLIEPPRVEAASARWHWHCERCGDPACERHLLPRLPHT